MNNQQAKTQKNACPSSSNNDEDQAQSNFLAFDLLTINDRKSTIFDSELITPDRQADCCFPSLCKQNSHHCKKAKKPEKIGKSIQKREKQSNDQRKISMNRKRKINFLQDKVQELQREIAALRRNQHYCLHCRQKLPGFYRQKITEIIQPEQPAPSVAGDFDSRRLSKDTVQFQQIDFHSPLMQTQEMQQKMWIFLGTMLIAMGSKVMDFDGTINTFRILKQSIDHMRRQVQKGEKSLGIDFFCCKQELGEPVHLIDGVNFDPFYSTKEDPSRGQFTLDGVKMECVEQYELFYDYKYKFCIKYDALLTIMQYARDHCTLS